MVLDGSGKPMRNEQDDLFFLILIMYNEVK